MVLWKISCLLIVMGVLHSEAGPLPKEKDTTEGNRASEAQENQALIPTNSHGNSQTRQGRQAYFYDYYSSPYDYYKSPYYSDYFNNYYDSSPYQQAAPAYQQHPQRVYPSRKKYTQRRRNFKATTQKYSIWDLARK